MKLFNIGMLASCLLFMKPALAEIYLMTSTHDKDSASNKLIFAYKVCPIASSNEGGPPCEGELKYTIPMGVPVQMQLFDQVNDTQQVVVYQAQVYSGDKLLFVRNFTYMNQTNVTFCTATQNRTIILEPYDSTQTVKCNGF